MDDRLIRASTIIPIAEMAWDLVREFRQTFGQPLPKVWTDADRSACHLQARLILEESDEIIWADGNEERLDGFCDTLYVIVGAMHAIALPKSFRPPTGVNWAGLAAEACNLLKTSGVLCIRRLTELLPELTVNIINNAYAQWPKFEGAFREVHRSNMDKLWSAEKVANELPIDAPYYYHPYDSLGKTFIVRDSKTHKVIKPPGWRPPELTPYL